MKTIEELLTSLARPDVLEFGLVTNRLPSVNVGGKFEPVDDVAPSSERILEMLTAVGGSRLIETLGDKAAQWTTHLEGVGAISVAAIRREDLVQARFTLTKREPNGARAAAVASSSTKPLSAPPLASPRTGPAFQPAGAKGLMARPPASIGAVRLPSSGQLPAVAPVAPAVAPVAPAVAPSTPPTAGRPAVAKPRKGAWDDDEPTVETVLPTGMVTSSPLRAPTPTSVEIVAVLPPRDKESDTYSISVSFDADADDNSSVDPLPISRQGLARPSSQSIAVVGDKPPPTLDLATSLETFLEMAVATRASDVHLVASRPLLCRIVSELVPHTAPLTAELVERLVKEAVPARLRGTLERDGACDFALEHPVHGRFRVNVSRQRTGYKLSLRVVPKDVPTLTTLGLPSVLAGIARIDRGLVLVTGLRGQGKSTTLAALVDHLNRETARHIMTIEDPIEHVHPKLKGVVTQRAVGEHSPTRARALDTALSSDVDTLVIAELRDQHCARRALAAADGGRLVLATMNAPSAARAVDRFTALLPAVEESWARACLASSLRLVTWQRLEPSAEGSRLHASVETLPFGELLAGKG